MTYTLSTHRPASAAWLTGASIRDLAHRYGVIVFLAAHVPLGLLIYQSRPLATLHAFTTLAVGLWWAAQVRRPERVAYVGAYITGAEVLWRMANAQIFWEFGKYATAAVFILALVRRRRLNGPLEPSLYFVLLLPSTALTILNTDLVSAQRQISANLSGPLALAISAWFFSHLKLTTKQLRQLFLALIGPLIGIAAITLFGTLTSSDVSFGTESNVVTSGGFGPNQVSGALGLGVLVALFCVVDVKARRNFKILMFGVMVLLAVQSALTFSRGGLYNAAGAAVLASFYLLKDARARVRLILVAALLFVVANYILLPRLDEFTGGALSARFQDIDLTHRDDIAQADLETWIKNPILGVGPGQREGPPTHTEFSRLLAEHGILGLAAILLILIAGARNLRQARTANNKAVVLSMMVWSFLFMLNIAMRLVAPAFTFGMTFTTVLPEETADLNSARKRRFKMIRERLAFTNRRLTAIGLTKFDRFDRRPS